MHEGCHLIIPNFCSAFFCWIRRQKQQQMFPFFAQGPCIYKMKKKKPCQTIGSSACHSAYLFFNWGQHVASRLSSVLNNSVAACHHHCHDYPQISNRIFWTSKTTDNFFSPPRELCMFSTTPLPSVPLKTWILFPSQMHRSLLNVLHIQCCWMRTSRRSKGKRERSKNGKRWLKCPESYTPHLQKQLYNAVICSLQPDPFPFPRQSSEALKDKNGPSGHNARSLSFFPSYWWSFI